MRLRPLSEAECYTRCYGERRGDGISLVKIVKRVEHRDGEALRRIADRHVEKAA